MAYVAVTVTQFKTFFARDFPYGTTTAEILDADITKALATAAINFNEGLWSSQATFETAFLYLAAHFLVESIKASQQGVASQYGGNTASKSVGNVSESYAIPDNVKNNPFLAGLYTDRYGATYVQLIGPRIIGNVTLMYGMTTP